MSYYELASLITFRPLVRPAAITIHGARPSPFSAGWSDTVEVLARELRMLNAQRAVLELDLRESDLRLDGLPRANANPATPGIVLSFHSTVARGDLRYEVATFDRWTDNIRAVALGLNALRAVDRYGITRSAEQYAGWKALPAPGATIASHEQAARARELIDTYGSAKAALAATHPDRGGDPDDFRAVAAVTGR